MDTISRRRLLYATQKHRRDGLIEFIREELRRCFEMYEKDEVDGRYLETLQYITKLIDAHRREPRNSRLHHLVPTVTQFFTELDLAKAYEFYNRKMHISSRLFVAPSFNEIRHMLNVAQVHATCSRKVRLLSFDGDQTLYADGSCISNQSLIDSIIRLMRDGVVIAIVTAASYGSDANGYERRIGLLLEEFVKTKLPGDVLANFFVVGGECNYMFRCNNKARLEYIPQDRWQPGIFDITPEEIKPILDVAQATLEKCVVDQAIPARLIRKERAVGIIPQVPGDRLRREALDETALSVQDALKRANVQTPFCAFNGGNDVFVDIGNKSIGIRGLLKLTGTDALHCLHVGDQFLTQGNDIACRETCPTIWITKPEETAYILKFVIEEVEANANAAAPGGGGGASSDGGIAKRAKLSSGAD